MWCEVLVTEVYEILPRFKARDSGEGDLKESLLREDFVGERIELFR